METNRLKIATKTLQINIRLFEIIQLAMSRGNKTSTGTLYTGTNSGDKV